MEVLMIAALGLMLAAFEIRSSAAAGATGPSERIFRHPRRNGDSPTELKRRRIIEREAATHERRLVWLDIRRAAESDPKLAARWEALLVLEMDRHARSLKRLA